VLRDIFVLMRQARNDGGKIQQDRQTKQRRQQKQQIGRIDDAHRRRHAMQQFTPRAHHQHRQGCPQPEQRIFLAQAPPPHQLQHEQQSGEGCACCEKN